MLREVAERGGACAAGAVPASFRDRVATELVGGPYEPVRPVIGQVRQEADAFALHVDALERRYPALAGLCGELIQRVHEHGVPEWLPNEIVVQRYRPGSVGITPHRDERRFAWLVAVLTIAGSATFTLCRNRAGEPIQTWQAGAGSLVLLRGPGLAGNLDGRLLHAVGGPTGSPRTSIGIRMDTALLSVSPRVGQVSSASRSRSWSGPGS